MLDTEKMGKKEKNKKKGKGAEKTIEKTQKKLKSKVKKETGEDDIENIGQAHDMFSRIFRIRTYKFFYQILCKICFDFLKRSKLRKKPEK